MKLYDIADTILDSAASEFLDYNTESPERIQEYAENAMNVFLTDKDVAQIQ